ncbi:MAG: PH domain-containing protein [Chloroflexi bacterium]|nr:PH domain-containing protein [Chloroflexota bacterium]
MDDVYLQRLLGERENVLLETRQHWFTLAGAILPEVTLIVAIVILVSFTWMSWVAMPVFAFGYLLLIFPLISLGRDVLIWRNHKYIVTNRRVIQIFGVFNKNVTDSSLEKVNDVKMEQSFFGRMFDFGDVEILTASELGINRFTRIGQPVRFKTAMLNAKQKLESGETLGQNHGPEDIPLLLERIGALRQSGILSEEEFQLKKADLLSRL